MVRELVSVRDEARLVWQSLCIKQNGKNSKGYHQGSNRVSPFEEHHLLPCYKRSMMLGERRKQREKSMLESEREKKEDSILELAILSA